jgi:hypothetical protein
MGSLARTGLFDHGMGLAASADIYAARHYVRRYFAAFFLAPTGRGAGPSAMGVRDRDAGGRSPRDISQQQSTEAGSTGRETPSESDVEAIATRMMKSPCIVPPN